MDSGKVVRVPNIETLQTRFPLTPLSILMVYKVEQVSIFSFCLIKTFNFILIYFSLYCDKGQLILFSFLSHNSLVFLYFKFCKITPKEIIWWLMLYDKPCNQFCLFVCLLALAIPSCFMNIHCLVGPMTPYTPLNIANIHNIDLIPATPTQYLLTPVNIYEFLLPP